MFMIIHYLYIYIYTYMNQISEGSVVRLRIMGVTVEAGNIVSAYIYIYISRHMCMYLYAYYICTYYICV